MLGQSYILQTERLGMRRYAISDLEALRAVFSDPYAAKFYPAMGQNDALERWIEWNLNNYAEHGFGLWALELLGNGLFIGDAGITYQTVEGERVLEIGWHIDPKFRSMGYASEAGLACLKFGFDNLRASEIGSIVDPANSASLKVASRVHEQRRSFQGKAGTMLFFSTTAQQFAVRANHAFEIGRAIEPRAVQGGR